ncbi:hypothetical protein AOLI_G00285580 [Acnodon oligacanthus]
MLVDSPLHPSTRQSLKPGVFLSGQKACQTQIRKHIFGSSEQSTVMVRSCLSVRLSPLAFPPLSDRPINPYHPDTLPPPCSTLPRSCGEDSHLRQEVAAEVKTFQKHKMAVHRKCVTD